MANQLNWRDKVKFSSGDTIKVHQKVVEGDKSRTQIFEGVVIRIKGNPGSKSFTVRKMGANKVGVEKIFPEDSPTVTNVEIVKQGRVRRANLSYLRDKVTKKDSKIKDRFVKADKEEEKDEEKKTEDKKEKDEVKPEKKADEKKETEKKEAKKGKKDKKDKKTKEKDEKKEEDKKE